MICKVINFIPMLWGRTAMSKPPAFKNCQGCSFHNINKRSGPSQLSSKKVLYTSDIKYADYFLFRTRLESRLQTHFPCEEMAITAHLLLVFVKANKFFHSFLTGNTPQHVLPGFYSALDIFISFLKIIKIFQLLSVNKIILSSFWYSVHKAQNICLFLYHTTNWYLFCYSI